MAAAGTSVIHRQAFDLHPPAYLSDEAKSSLISITTDAQFPALDDKEAWRRYVAQVDPMLRSLASEGVDPSTLETEELDISGVKAYTVTPKDLPTSDVGIVLEMHGGAFILGAGETCRATAQRSATRLRRKIISIDYRMAPDHPYPASLDDCIVVYRSLLRTHDPSKIIFSGQSAGGNLAAALSLRARDEGLPLPAAVVLQAPEIDLTESGDSFQTNNGVDPVLKPLMQVNLLYANGRSLTEPYLSPLFADLTKGFPPTLVTGGTRDLFLSNSVRFHRALRKAGVEAELHILDGAGHAGFPRSPEGEELEAELRRFIARFWGSQT